MNVKHLLIALFCSILLAPSAFAVDDPEQISDRLIVIEIQLDALTEFLVNNPAGLIKICHIPRGDYQAAHVALVNVQALKARFRHYDYLLTSDDPRNEGEYCQPFFG
jgi:hypothetical protein